MKKSTKGALAAAAAGVLLLGGAGTLAYWTDSDTATGTDITTGHLSVDASDCAGTTGWELDGNVAFDPSTDFLVPGDTLTKDCNVVVDVAGTHLTQVDVLATTPTSQTAPWDELTIGATVAGSSTGDNNVAVTPNSTNNIPVTITVTWPYGNGGVASQPDPTTADDNDLNGDLSTTLGDIVVTVVQDHAADDNGLN